jgi:hypothetical protein
MVQLACPAGMAVSALVNVPGTNVVLRWLIAVAGANRDALASLGAPARQYGLAAFGLHTLPESMHFGTVAAVGLECPFWHVTDCSCFQEMSMSKR